MLVLSPSAGLDFHETKFASHNLPRLAADRDLARYHEFSSVQGENYYRYCVTELVTVRRNIYYELNKLKKGFRSLNKSC